MADQNVDNMSATWNSGGTTFTAIKHSITDTASAAASKLVEFFVGGASKFAIRKDGRVTSAAGYGLTADDVGALGASGTAFSDAFLASGAVINFNAGNVTITHAAGGLTITGTITFTG